MILFIHASADLPTDVSANQSTADITPGYREHIVPGEIRLATGCTVNPGNEVQAMTGAG